MTKQQTEASRARKMPLAEFGDSRVLPDEIATTLVTQTR
jgi:hypothetical protein